MKTLALIPARSGSKGIPRKNIRLLGGKPLIAWSIEAALASTYIDSVIVSTDDTEIADIGRQYGAEIPFMRPPELALDTTPGMDPVLHAIDLLPDFDHVLLLQPTSPLRTTDDINRCIQLAIQYEASSVVSVCEPANSPYWMYRLNKNSRLNPLFDSVNADNADNTVNTINTTRRQELPPVYTLNGALYFANCAWLRKSKTFVTNDTVGFIMPREKSIDIDVPMDWKLAELMLAELSQNALQNP